MKFRTIAGEGYAGEICAVLAGGLADKKEIGVGVPVAVDDLSAIFHECGTVFAGLGQFEWVFQYVTQS